MSQIIQGETVNREETVAKDGFKFGEEEKDQEREKDSEKEQPVRWKEV